MRLILVTGLVLLAMMLAGCVDQDCGTRCEMSCRANDAQFHTVDCPVFGEATCLCSKCGNFGEGFECKLFNPWSSD